MRRIKTICVLLSALVAIVSCIDSGDDYQYGIYDDAAITTFSLGTLNRYIHTTSSTGEDSIYKTTVTGSSYQFHIDQINHLIYNTDSLPIGTDIAHVLCDITTRNNGTVVLQDVDSDTLRYYSSSDSIDFTTPRKILVYNSMYTGYNEYTVSVNVHQEEENKFVWQQMETNSELAALENVKAIASGNQIHVFGQSTTDHRLLMYKMYNGWQELPAFEEASKFGGMFGGPENFFVLYDNNLAIANDAMQIEEYRQTGLDNLKQLIGGTSKELYALSHGNRLMVSYDAGITWQEDQLDEDATMLPVQDIACISYPMNLEDNTDYVLIVGNRSVSDYPQENIAMVWRKIVDNSKEQTAGRWVYMERTEDNRAMLPRLKNLTMVKYDDGILALGGAGLGGAADKVAYAQFYQSRDNGITWKYNSRYQLPDDFDNNATSVAAVADQNNYIWLFCGGTGQIWRGRLNRLGWEYQ